LEREDNYVAAAVFVTQINVTASFHFSCRERKDLGTSTEKVNLAAL
jgi:hypothetical protein